MVKNPCQCRRHKRCGFDPWVGKIPWSRAWQSTPVCLPGESHGQRDMVGYGPWGHRVRHDWCDLAHTHNNLSRWFVFKCTTDLFPSNDTMNLWGRLGLNLAYRVAKQWERKPGRQWRGWGGGKGGCGLETADAEGWTFNNHWGCLVIRSKKIGVEQWEGIMDFLCPFMRPPGYHRVHCENMYFTDFKLHTDEGIETSGARHPSSCTDSSNTGYTCGKCHSLFLLSRRTGV